MEKMKKSILSKFGSFMELNGFFSSFFLPPSFLAARSFPLHPCSKREGATDKKYETRNSNRAPTAGGRRRLTSHLLSPGGERKKEEKKRVNPALDKSLLITYFPGKNNAVNFSEQSTNTFNICVLKKL